MHLRNKHFPSLLQLQLQRCSCTLQPAFFHESCITSSDKVQVLVAVVGDNWFKRVNFELQALVLPGGTSSHSHAQASPSAESSEGSATSAPSGTSSPEGQSQTRHSHNPEFPSWAGSRPRPRDQSLHDPAAAIRWTEDQLRDKQRSLRSFETEFRQVMHVTALALLCISPMLFPQHL